MKTIQISRFDVKRKNAGIKKDVGNCCVCCCLQSTSMSVGSTGVIDQAAVYTCTGSPMPADIEQLMKWLLNEDLSTAYKKIVQLQEQKGLALVDITRELTPCVPAHTRPPTLSTFAGP